ncbi:MAG: PQQ-dependent sugar dehydrogenase [Phycisphaerales bacterium]|nr:PQQ-dependent sugar dehydrogenase [Phycisphaerales bacterium]
MRTSALPRSIVRVRLIAWLTTGAILLTTVTGCGLLELLLGAGNQNGNENINSNENGNDNSANDGVALQLLAEGLVAPVDALSPQDDTRRLFVVDQIGVIRIIDGNGTLLDAPFLDLRDRMAPLNSAFDERGLLGLAFHPNYANNGRFFVYYSAPKSAGVDQSFDSETRVSEFTVSADANLAAADSERIFLHIGQPQPNHKGGEIEFGPDNFLYIATGDGGGSNDTGLGHSDVIGNAQDLSNLLGKILRIDVDSGSPYGIPADNPFASNASARGEIWAYGFRNPYRFAFDRGGAQRLFAGDVGQGLREEVDIVVKGGNFGWNIREGDVCFDKTNNATPLASCSSTALNGAPLIEPIIAYGHPDSGAELIGLSVIGGHVYRGPTLFALNGQYVFGDWSQGFLTGGGRMYVASENGAGVWSVEELPFTNRAGGRLGEYLAGIGLDSEGEILLLTREVLGLTGATGKVYRLVPGEQQ